MRQILFSLLVLFTVPVFSQTGVITINDKAKANELVERHIFFNKEHGQLPGYRIQILSATSLGDVKTAKSAFLQQYDEYKANIIFEAPNYKLRVGNYSNRFDANRDLQDILIEYPNAFIVKDLINIAE